MFKTRIWQWMGWLLLAASCRLVAAEPEARPNIIFLLADDHRYDQLGCAGHPILQTPHIDALAEAGVRFDRAYVTTPICAASRASIFTSLHERTHGYTFRTPPLARPYCRDAYPAVLKAQGYRTGFIGKFGIGVERGVTESWFDFFRPLTRSPYFKKMPDGSLRHTTELCGDLALEFLKTSARDNRPFCLSISFNAPHAEDADKQMQYPAPYAVATMYEDVEIPGPRLADPDIYASQPELLKRSLNRVRYYWRWDTPEKYQKNIRGYYRMISGIDRVVGRIRRELKRLGLADNTILIYSGDNGYYLAQRGFAGKWSHYEESLRVPLIIYDPRRPRPEHSVVSAFVLNIDIPATVVSLAGIELPKGYQGRSLVPWLEGQQPDHWRTHFFCEHLMEYPIRIPEWEGVRTERWKYARYFESSPAQEFLHDLKADPEELRNLAGEESYRGELERLRKLCVRERQRLEAARDEGAGDSAKGRPSRQAATSSAQGKAQPKKASPAKKKTAQTERTSRGSKRSKRAPHRSEQPPNIVLIISDDQGWTDYGFMGHPIIRTPRLDQLARESLTFARGYVPTSLCRPSLMTMITGLYPSQHGVTGNDPALPGHLRGKAARRDAAYLATCQRLTEKVRALPTIPRLLESEGYVSFQSGKWWEGPYRNGGFTHGMTHGDPRRGGRHGDLGLKIGREGLEPIFAFIDEARKAGKPFFLWYAPFLPHAPHTPPERILKRYRRKGRPESLARYYAMCEWFDETCGELLDYLDTHGLRNNTLVLYVCDNGWIQQTPERNVPKGWKSHFAPKSKQSPYDGGVRTPILVRWPGHIRPRRHPGLASSVDLFPTILEAAGVRLPEAPDGLQYPGVSLLKVADGRRRTPHQAVFGEIFAHDIADLDDYRKSLLYRWGIRDDWKLILKFSGTIGRYRRVHAWMSSKPELYDLAADPHEREDRAEKYPDVVADLQKALETHFAKVGAPAR